MKSEKEVFSIKSVGGKGKYLVFKKSRLLKCFMRVFMLNLLTNFEVFKK